MRFSHRPVRVIKRGPGPAWVARLSTKISRGFEKDLIREIRKIASGVNASALSSLIVSGRIDDIISQSGVKSVSGVVRSGLRNVVSDGLAEGSALGAKAVEQRVVLDLGRPRVTRWIARHSAEAVAGIQRTGQAAIRSVVSDGFKRGKLPAEIANDVKGIIGLTDGQALAVTRRRAALLESGTSPANAARRASRYASRLLAQRARTIARHEAMSALNAGRSQMWLQLRDDGAIDRGQLQEWLTADDERVCPYCGPLDGQQVKLGGEFDGEIAVVSHPPLHVNCRCTLVLV